MVRKLNEIFRSRDLQKIYWAAVAGVPKPAKGTIRYGLLKGGHPRDEKMQAIHPGKFVQGSNEVVRKTHLRQRRAPGRGAPRRANPAAP